MGTSPEGAAQTASSLVTRGLVGRRRRDGRVHYFATTEGRAFITPGWPQVTS